MKLLWSNFTEPVIILAGHHDIYIIVPWDKTLMPYRTQHRTSTGIVFQLMPDADLLQTVQKIKLYCPNFLAGSANLKPVPDFGIEVTFR